MVDGSHLRNTLLMCMLTHIEYYRLSKGRQIHTFTFEMSENTRLFIDHLIPSTLYI